MNPTLIKIGGLVINPAHVAYAAIDEDGTVAVHMAVADPRGGHPVLRLDGNAARRVWAALAARPTTEPEGV